jgi:nitrous oxidase accessory protein NosD
VFDKDNITLDCNGYQVHISSFSKPNCFPVDGQMSSTCGIVAIGRSNVTIKNCRVVGGFDYSVSLDGTNGATIADTQVSGLTGFSIRNAHDTNGHGLLARGSDQDGLDLSNDYYGSYAITVQNVGGTGVFAADSQGTFFDHPSISGAGEYGMYLYASTNMSVSGGDVEQSNVLGILLSQSSALSINDTTCTGNGAGSDSVYDGVNDGKGIQLYKVTSSTFSNNRFVNNSPPCDAYYGPDSAGNTWTGSVFGVACFYREPR